MSCTCSERHKALTWTAQGPTPHEATCVSNLDSFQRQAAEKRRLADENARALVERVHPAYAADHAALVAYLLSAVRRADWHAVADAACDLRVLEAKRS